MTAGVYTLYDRGCDDHSTHREFSASWDFEDIELRRTWVRRQCALNARRSARGYVYMGKHINIILSVWHVSNGLIAQLVRAYG